MTAPEITDVKIKNFSTLGELFFSSKKADMKRLSESKTKPKNMGKACSFHIGEEGHKNW